MHSKVKLSKREIKEDKFTTFVLTAKDQFAESWQYIVIGAVVVVLVVAGTIYFFSNRSSQQIEGAEKLSKALADYHSNNTQVALLSFGQIASDYSGSAADEATFMLGKVNLETQNYAEARKQFENYLGRSTGDKLKRAAALAGLAGCLEGEAKYAEAAAKYLDAAKEFPGGPQDEEFQISAMRAFLDAGDTEKAKVQLAELKKQFKGSGKVYRAEMMLAEKTTASR
jgi:predicted negative regulator of RcsB-dependent stress response